MTAQPDILSDHHIGTRIALTRKRNIGSRRDVILSNNVAVGSDHGVIANSQPVTRRTEESIRTNIDTLTQIDSPGFFSLITEPEDYPQIKVDSPA